MATGNEQSTFSLVFDNQVSDPAEDAANSVEALRERLGQSTSALKELQAAERRLVGTSKEVIAAKKELKSKIGAAKDAISATQLALLKEADAAKKLEDRTKALAKWKDAAKEKSKSLNTAISTAGGPVAALRDKFSGLGEVLTGAGGKASIFVAAAAGVLAALVALGVAAVAAGVALAKFVIGGANAARSANLLREAAAGGAANAYALGTQVDALADKVPTAKDALNELAVSMAKGGIQGQTLVDTLNAVGQANAALGDDAGAKLRELVDRGRLTQRFFVNPLELQGTGINFQDIAAELATSMHVGVKDAQAALFEGRVKLADGAAAMRAAVEKKFGDINLRKSLDLDVMAAKLREKLQALTKDVNLEPLLKGFNSLLKIFDDSTVTGAALKQLINLFGNGVVKAIGLSAPVAKKFIQGMTIGALQTAIVVLKLRNQFVKTFGDKDIFKGIDVLNLALETGKFLVTSLAMGLAALAVIIGAIGAAAYALSKPFIDGYNAIKDIDWAATGTAIIDGIIGGIKNGVARVEGAVTDLGNRIKNGLKDTLQIHSPSKVGFKIGEQTTEGVAGGIEARGRDVDKAIGVVTDLPAPRPARGGNQAAAAPPVINVTINAPGATKEAVEAMADDGFTRKLTQALLDAVRSMGLAPA